MIKRLSKFIILWSLVCTTFSAKTNQKLCNTYTVQQGDTCYSLGIDPSLNPSINCNPLLANTQICVNYGSVKCGSGTYSYTIKSGDTCYSLGVSVSSASNQGYDCSNLPIGSAICVPYYTVTSTPYSCSGNQHVVQSGETCYLLGISQSSAALQGLNCQNLQIGQTVCVPNQIQTSTYKYPITCGSSSSYPYLVKSGDTCDAIGITAYTAQNQGINCNNLQVGQFICAPYNIQTTTHPNGNWYCPQGSYQYIVKSGDTCNTIGINVQSASSQGLNCQNLQIGQKVCASYYIAPTSTPAYYTTGGSCGTNSYYYTVQNGDNCYTLKITQAYASSNGINCNPLQVGSTICLPYNSFTTQYYTTPYYTTTGTNPSLSIYCGINTYSYTLKPGDSCYSLGITQSLAAAQNINCNLLQTGQTICAPYFNQIVTTPPTNLVCKTRYYTVAPGDSCQSIASANNYLYTDLIALNGGTLNCNTLAANQVICV